MAPAWRFPGSGFFWSSFVSFAAESVFQGRAILFLRSGGSIWEASWLLFGGPQGAFDVLFCGFLGQHADHLFFDDVPSVFFIFARLRALLWTYKSSLSVRLCLMRMM